MPAPDARSIDSEHAARHPERDRTRDERRATHAPFRGNLDAQTLAIAAMADEDDNGSRGGGPPGPAAPPPEAEDERAPVAPQAPGPAQEKEKPATTAHEPRIVHVSFASASTRPHSTGDGAGGNGHSSGNGKAGSRDYGNGNGNGSSYGYGYGFGFGAHARASGDDDFDSGLSEDEAREAGLIGPVASRGKAREWALVLQSMGLSYAMFHSSVLVTRGGGGWLLRVAPGDRARALASIEAYEKENEGWLEAERDVPRHRPSLLVPLAFLALAAFFFVTGPSAGNSFWFARGTADASQLASAPWRMVTALTLHADLPHVLGNIVSGGIFGAILSRRLGFGAALFGMVVAATCGNALNAVHHLASGHYSIGASTAVFAAVGMLAGTQVALLGAHAKTPERTRGIRRFLAPLVGGLALLGSLGASPQTDLWAHFYGFVAGVVFGLGAGFIERRRLARPSSKTGQGLFYGAALALVIVAWQVALRN